MTFPAAAGEPPRQLKGYEKVRLGRGRSAKVTFRLEAATDLAVYDEGARRFVVPHGRYTMWVGSSSRDLDERAGFDLGGRRHRR